MRLLLTISVLLVVVVYHEAGSCPKACEEYTNSCGPIPPVVPDSYIMKSLVVDNVAKNFVWEEEYFDPDNFRGKHVIVTQGRERTYIFDYALNIITLYERLHPGAPLIKDEKSRFMCETKNMDMDNPLRDIMGYKFGNYNVKRSNMYSSNEALAFGGPYRYSYDKNTTKLPERGIETNSFVGCVEDKYANKNVQNKFIWSKNLQPSIASETTPLKLESIGWHQTPGEEKCKKFNKVSDIVYFEPNPSMSYSTFQAPARMDCGNTQINAKPIPKLSKYFSARVEILVTEYDFTGKAQKTAYDSYQEDWFDAELQLARQDYFPSIEDILEDTTSLINSNLPVTEIHDFNTGITYLTDKTYGLCEIKPMRSSSFSSAQSNDSNVIMGDANEVYNFNEQLFYKGTYKVRDMDCDAWSGKEKEITEVGLSPFVEAYFTTGANHLDVDGIEQFSVPVRKTEIRPSTLEGQSATKITDINFYKFKATKPSLSVYDIPSCVQQHNKKSFLIDFKVKLEEKEIIGNNQYQFLDAARLLIRNLADLGSLIRVQEIDLVFNGDVYTLYFTILDTPHIKGNVVEPKLGVSLDKAQASLNKSIDDGKFIVAIKAKASREIIEVKAEKGSLEPVMFNEKHTKIEYTSKDKQMSPKKFETEAEKLPTAWTNLFNDKRIYYMNGDGSSAGPHLMAAPAQELNSPNGYSAGSVAGLAIAMLIIGIIGGVGIMFFYLKKVRNLNTEEADFGLTES